MNAVGILIVNGELSKLPPVLRAADEDESHNKGYIFVYLTLMLIEELGFPRNSLKWQGVESLKDIEMCQK